MQRHVRKASVWLEIADLGFFCVHCFTDNSGHQVVFHKIFRFQTVCFFYDSDLQHQSTSGVPASCKEQFYPHTERRSSLLSNLGFGFLGLSTWAETPAPPEIFFTLLLRPLGICCSRTAVDNEHARSCVHSQMFSSRDQNQMEFSYPSLFDVCIIILITLGLRLHQFLTPPPLFFLSLCIFPVSLSCEEVAGVWAALRIHHQSAEFRVSHTPTEKVPATCSLQDFELFCFNFKTFLPDSFPSHLLSSQLWFIFGSSVKFSKAR